MARRKKSEGGGPGSGDWLNTYADMVTLLLTFFILLFSMSSLDAAKWNMLVSAFASDRESSDRIVLVGDVADQPEGEMSLDVATKEIDSLDDIYDYLVNYVERENLQDSIDVEKGEDWVFIRFMDDLLFEPNSAVLRSEDEAILDFVGLGIKSVQDEVNSINIIGHTAAIPENPNYPVSDRDLSTRRANAVLVRFEDELELDSTKLMATGYGKWKPVASNDDEEGRRQNRRVEILLSSESSLYSQLDNIYDKLIED